MASSNNVELIAPEFLLIEFSKDKSEILSKTHRSEEDFSKLLSIFEKYNIYTPNLGFGCAIPYL